MSNLEKINSILHSDLLCTTTVLEEKTVKMKIPIISTGCKSLLYKYDKELRKEYKGGLFPFLQKSKRFVVYVIILYLPKPKGHYLC